RAEIERVARTVEKIETAVAPRFQEHFVDALAIPHRRDPFPRLGAVVPLPETGGDGMEQTRGRRRRVARTGPAMEETT
ncbi:MAG: ASKHA domain-containing protein, partial [Chloroflexota bacterium]